MPLASSKPAPHLELPGKSNRLVVLGEQPLVAETPEHQLGEQTTPTEKFFIRNNGTVPEATRDPLAWRVTIDGEVERALTLTLGDIQSRFEPVTRHLVLECGGNGRSFFSPTASGNLWTNGGVGCAQWTGVRLRDLLLAAGVKSSAVFTGHYSADRDFKDPMQQAMSRGVPIAKALDENNLVAWAMNGEPLPLIHGFPLRLVIPGWPGSVSSKWLTRIWVRDRRHDEKGMTSYRVPVHPIVPGGTADPDNLRDLESMPVRSIVTSPHDGAKLPADVSHIALHGAAWAGDTDVARVDVSIDYGATWREAALLPRRNAYDWHRWTATIACPGPGYYEIWARATDTNGVAQPHAAANWNPQGYGANPMHRVAVTVG
jgi:DMSO/TMAO reductase YedYZ molybdopterin-dependent catalytic subunit